MLHLLQNRVCSTFFHFVHVLSVGGGPEIGGGVRSLRRLRFAISVALL
jgi:hypothetical protein